MNHFSLYLMIKLNQYFVINVGTKKLCMKGDRA